MDEPAQLRFQRILAASYHQSPQGQPIPCHIFRKFSILQVPPQLFYTYGSVIHIPFVNFFTQTASKYKIGGGLLFPILEPEMDLCIILMVTVL